MSGIQYISAGAPTGYGLAGIAYVRGLVNAGVPVHWVQTQWNRPTLGFELRMVPALAGDESLVDLAALIEATRRPIAHDACVVQLPPEEWARWHRPGQHNVGYTAWETDRPPAHWVPLMNAADAVLVPCQFNQDVFVRYGVHKPVRVVPHIRRHRWNVFKQDERLALRNSLGIADSSLVFYCISTWDVRKNLAGLIRAFAQAFRREDAVSLVIKTSQMGNTEGPLHLLKPCAELVTQVLEACEQRLQRAAPHVVVVAEETVSGRYLDGLHEIGDCYVSLSYGEGWGLGAFDAASRGTPVITSAWSATVDFMGENWPGTVQHRMCGVCLWPTIKPTYFPSMRWAAPDEAGASQLMRDFVAAPATFREAAAGIERSILQRFSEPVITQAMLAAVSDSDQFSGVSRVLKDVA